MRRPTSVKSDRYLRAVRVRERLAAGESVVVTGPRYALQHTTGDVAALAFVLQGDTLCVGYAVQGTGGWQVIDCEPYSMRALGYWQRWLKRHGVPVSKPPRR